MRYYIEGLKKYAVASGRTSRKEFWMYYLWEGLFLLLAIFLDDYFNLYPLGLSQFYGYLTSIFIYATLLPTICCQIRRLHDIGKSGNWIWLGSVPIANLYLIYLYTKRGDDFENQYGVSCVGNFGIGRDLQTFDVAIGLSGDDYKAVESPIKKKTETNKLYCSWYEDDDLNIKDNNGERLSTSKMLFCAKCDRKLSGDSKFCQYCGAKVKNKNSANERVLLIASIGFIILSIFAAAFLYYGSYQKACEYACNGQFIEAEENLLFPKITERHDPDLLVCIEAGKNFENRPLSTYRTIERYAREGNPYAKASLEDLKQMRYFDAVKLVNEEKYRDAIDVFNTLDGYKDSRKYYLLCAAMTNKWDSEEYKEILQCYDFKNMKAALVSYTAIAEKFLGGTWKTSDGKYYFKISEKGASYNLPWLDLPDSYYSFEDGVYSLRSGSWSDDGEDFKKKDIFKFYVQDVNTISVYCFKNGQFFTLYRQ